MGDKIGLKISKGKDSLPFSLSGQGALLARTGQRPIQDRKLPSAEKQIPNLIITVLTYCVNGTPQESKNPLPLNLGRNLTRIGLPEILLLPFKYDKASSSINN